MVFSISQSQGQVKNEFRNHIHEKLSIVSLNFSLHSEIWHVDLDILLAWINAAPFIVGRSLHRTVLVGRQIVLEWILNKFLFSSTVIHCWWVSWKMKNWTVVFFLTVISRIKVLSGRRHHSQHKFFLFITVSWWTEAFYNCLICCCDSGAENKEDWANENNFSIQQSFLRSNIWSFWSVIGQKLGFALFFERRKPPHTVVLHLR